MRTWRLDAPDADLRSWSADLGDARVIGLGEATHGTAEFFTLEHRLITHLVAERGVRVVAFEASEAAAARVDRWIAGSDDDGRAALGALGFRVWDTTEVLALLTTLRTINATLADAERVRFVGVDPQLPDAAPPVEVVVAAARVARAAVRVTAPRDDPAASYAVRDRLMAEAVLALVGRDPGPVAFWAHNGHVRRRAEPVATTGEHLRRALGDGYRPIGLLAVDGAFRARRSRGPLLAPARTPTVHHLGRAPVTTLEGRLAADHDGDLLVDLRHDPPAWCREASWTRSHGACAPMVPAVAHTPVVPSAEFDGLAVVRHTSPSTPLA